MNAFLKLRLAVVAALCLSLSHLPEAVAGEVATGRMITTQEAVADVTRGEAESKIRAQLDREEVKEKLATLGVDADEAKMKLASLSDQELQQMAAQMEKAQFGGDVTGILVVVVLVLLIIFLAKRV